MAADRGRFRLNLWLTVCTLPVLAVLLGLGTWQVQRLEWKKGVIAERVAAYSAPALPLAAVPADWRGYAFRRVKAEGRFRHDLEVITVPKSHRGRTGAHVVTPLILSDGGVVLVNRGWVPRDRLIRAKRGEGNPEGPVVVEGVMRAGGPRSSWTPGNQPGKEVWHYIDPPTIAAWRGLDGVKPYFVEAGPAPNPGGFPLGGLTRINPPNNHLQYAITWYALAVVLVVIYIVFHLKRRV